jgi:hypothetical protein
VQIIRLRAPSDDVYYFCRRAFARTIWATIGSFFRGFALLFALLAIPAFLTLRDLVRMRNRYPECASDPDFSSIDRSQIRIDGMQQAMREKLVAHIWLSPAIRTLCERQQCGFKIANVHADE